MYMCNDTYDLYLSRINVGFNTHCIGYITTGSFKERGNQYTLVGQDFAL